MRELSSTLLQAQKAHPVRGLVKLALTYNDTTYTYLKDRILNIKEVGDGSLQTIEITLQNRDGSLTDIDFRGYEGVLSFGATTSAGDEYSAIAPMTVRAQEFLSEPDELHCTLTLIGMCNDMEDDEASELYEPDTDDNKSVKTLVDSIARATLSCFSHCKEYITVWESGYDGLADTYIPKDAFRIYTSNNRRAAIDRLLAYTENVMLPKADGRLHIFKPTTTGTTYDSEYKLDASEHQFFAKALRNRLVIPNYVKVQSRETDDPQYSGTATDSESYALLPKAQYKETYLASDAEAADIAAAILARAKLWCESGSASVPMNVGTEGFDYIKVTDSREDDSRVGNIGKYTRTYDVRKNLWKLSFSFGNWQNIRKVLQNLNITGDDIENYFSRLRVGTLYAENIILDDVLDGTYYQRASITALNASGMVILDQVIVGTYGLVLVTDIQAGHILLSKTVKDGKWHDETGVVIDASYGIALYGGEGINAFRTFATQAHYEAGTPVQVYIGTDGKFYAAGGQLAIDQTALHIYGNEAGDYFLRFYDTSLNQAGRIGVEGDLFYLCAYPSAGKDVYLGAANGLVWIQTGEGLKLDFDPDCHVLPVANDRINLGSMTYQFKGGYFASRTKIPVGTDKYD